MNAPMIQLNKLLLACAAILSLTAARPAEAKIYIEINTPSKSAFPVAIPLFKDVGRTPGRADLGKEFADQIVADLRLTGLFNLLDRGMYLENPAVAGLLPDQFDFASWQQIDALGLVKGGYEVKGDTVTVHLRIYDVLATAQIGGKVYTGSVRDVRRLSHKMASEIMYQFTGTTGFFNTKIAAVSNATGQKEIVVMDVDGKGMTALTNNKSINLLPAWSRTGSKIAYTSYKSGNPDLYVADLVAGLTRRVAFFPGINSGAAWSPQGHVIALTLSKDNNPDIYLIDDQGKELARLTRSFGVDSSPAWSPDGRKIAFVSSRAGGTHIHVMNADGSDVKRLTFVGGQNLSPTWSPKGDRIAFVSRDRGFSDIFLMKTDGSDMKRITTDAGDNEDPSFSPDGNFLLFSSTRNDHRRSQLYIANLSNDYQVCITNGNASYSNPDWSPSVDW